MMDERGVDSLPVALAASLIVLAVIFSLTAQGLRQAEPAVSTASVDGQVSAICDECKALLACSPRDLLDPASPPGARKMVTISLPPDTAYLAFGTDPGSENSDEGTIYYSVHGNKKAVHVDRIKFREGIPASHLHRIIEGGGKYELTIEYQYDRGLDQKYLVIY
jgi:hypothetical protein